MRLFKKAAVSLLAAAMVISMFTACSGSGENPADSRPDHSTEEPENPSDKKDDNSGGQQGGTEEDGETLPTSWANSKVMTSFNEYGITPTDVWMLAFISENENQQTIVYAAKGSKAYMQFLNEEGTRFTRNICKYGNEYYTGNYSYSSGDSDNYTIQWSKSDKNEIEQFDIYQKVLKIPAATDVVRNYKCIKVEETYYQESVTINGLPYTYCSDNIGLEGIITIINGQIYNATTKSISRCPSSTVFPNPNVR